MTPVTCSLIRRAIAPLLAFHLLVFAGLCFADAYSDYGTISLTGTVDEIYSQEVCTDFSCHLGDSWGLSMAFVADDWNAPGSSYLISTVLLNCIGGPPCITGYAATSNFGWGPYGFDILSIDIEDGEVVDVRAGCGGYSIEWGEDDSWSYYNAFSGRTAGYAVPGPPVPDAATIFTFTTGVILVAARLK